ncbi:hypothetical protein [Bradyrhizobium sp. USDA 3650]
MIIKPGSGSLLGGGANGGNVAEVGVFVPVGEVFPGVAADERSLIEVLATLSRDDTLFHCARLNIIVSGPGDFEVKPRQEQAISFACNSDQLARINAFARRRGGGLPVVFFTGQLRELMRWASRYCKNRPDDGTSFEDPALRSQFVKAALIASDIWARRVFSDKLAPNDDIEAVRRRALGAFRKGADESNLALHIGIAIGRGLALFTEYMPRHFPEFGDEFEKATGLTLRQYLGCATTMALYALQHRKEGPLFDRNTVAAATPVADLYPRFFDLVSQSPEQLARSFWTNFDTLDYRGLRERPVMTTADGRGIILDPAFFIERVSIGAVFNVAARVRTKVFAKFGEVFEDYAIDILRRMYPHVAGLVDRVAFRLCGQDGQRREFEIDAAVFEVREAAIIEMKAAFLAEKALAHEDPEALIVEIRSKYGASQKPGERDKGVAQLARSIGAIARGEWLGADGQFRDMDVLHPVLVVHDSRLDAPGLGNFLEADFRRLLGAVPAGRRVGPLTIVTIADLESLEKSIEGFGFMQLLRDYDRECPDRMRSLHNYLAYSEYGKKILPSEFLIDRSVEVLDLLQAELFPDATMPDRNWHKKT